MTAIARPVWFDQLLLVGGFCLAGGVLSAHVASLLTWLIVETLVIYLAWSSTGAIALSLAISTGIVWAELFSTQLSERLWFGDGHLTSAQLWAIDLLVSWGLSGVLCFQLAFAAQRLTETDLSRSQAVLLLLLISNLGLILGKLIHLWFVSGYQV